MSIFSPARVAMGVPLRRTSWSQVLGSGYEWGMRKRLLPIVLPPFSKLTRGTVREQVQLGTRNDFLMGRTLPSGGQRWGSHPEVWEQRLAIW